MDSQFMFPVCLKSVLGLALAFVDLFHKANTEAQDTMLKKKRQ